MTAVEQQRVVAALLSQYMDARDEEVPAAWARLESALRAPRDSMIIAETARAAHRALQEAIEARRELIEAIEGGPNNLLPILAAIDESHYVVSQGNGVYQRVGVAPGEEGAPRLLDPEELARRGPALAALDASGSLIVDVYWPDEHRELFLLVFGGDEGRVVSVGDDADDRRPDAEPLPLPLEAGHP